MLTDLAPTLAAISNISWVRQVRRRLSLLGEEDLADDSLITLALLYLRGLSIIQRCATSKEL